MSDYRSSHLDKGEDYDDIFRLRLRESLLWKAEKQVLADFLASHFQSSRPSHLDFACGTGRVLAYLTPFVSRSVGVDVSAAMLEVARRRAPEARILQTDLTRKNSLTNERFDVITAFRFFPNAQPSLRKEAIEALAPLLSDHGVIIFNNHLNDRSTTRRLQRLARRPLGHAMSRDEIDQLCAWGGLQVQASVGLGILPDFGDSKAWNRAFVRLDRHVYKNPFMRELCENQIFLLTR